MPANGISENSHAHHGRDPERHWLTLPDRKRVLAVVHTVPYAKRLREIVDLAASDFRIQVLFTAPPHELGDGVTRFLRRIGGPVLPWAEAVRLTYDLVLAAGPRGLGEIRGPVVTVPHGAGYLKRMVGTADQQVNGLRPADILLGDGRLPAAVVLPHRDDVVQLERWCPEAVPVATVVGDPVHDRIAASLPERSAYRAALGLCPDHELLVVVSTWGPRSSFRDFEALLPRLLSELPPTSHRKVAVLVHPNVWSAHGPYQIHSWLARCMASGVAVVPPEADWRPVLVAADSIIGDHGSVSLYGTLTGAPILLAATPAQEINPDSPAADLALTAPTLSPAGPLSAQLDYARAEYRRAEYAVIASRITSEPGRFNRNMRRLLYRMLGLGQPAHDAPTLRLPLPPPLHTWTQGLPTA